MEWTDLDWLQSTKRAGALAGTNSAKVKDIVDLRKFVAQAGSAKGLSRPVVESRRL